MDKEIQIFIIWENARAFENIILNEIRKKFIILKEYEIFWTPNLFSKNLSAFYGINYIYNTFQIELRGKGPFVLIIAEDKNPMYEKRKTNRGFIYVNINSFDLKQKIRQFIKSFAFHSSNNMKEVKYGIAVLLGKNLKDFFKTTELNGKREILYRDTLPAIGWKNLNDFFYILNETCNYVILKNIESVSDINTYKENSLNFLVDDIQAFLATLNPTIATNKNIFHFFNYEKFGENNKNLMVYSTFVGDNYYDINMQKKMLKTKVLNADNVYILSDDMCFWSIVYNIIFHQENLQKYDKTLKKLAINLGIEYKSEKEHLRSLITDYIKNNNYKIYEHLCNKSTSLVVENIKDKSILKKEPEYYCYNNSDFRFLVFSEDAILYEPEMVTEFINIYGEFLDLDIHILDKKSPIYNFVKEKYKENEKLWHFRKRYYDISVFSYKKSNNKESFSKNFLSGKKTIKSKHFTYNEEINVPKINNRTTFLDILLKKYVENGEEIFLGELDNFISEVFCKFECSKKNYLKPIAWDALPKNCFYKTENGKIEYIFFDFDKDIIYNKPLKKSMYLVNVLIDFDYKFNFSISKKYDFYKIFINKYKLKDVWINGCIQRYIEILETIKLTYNNCYEIVENVLKIKKKNLILIYLYVYLPMKSFIVLIYLYVYLPMKSFIVKIFVFLGNIIFK